MGQSMEHSFYQEKDHRCSFKIRGISILITKIENKLTKFAIKIQSQIRRAKTLTKASNLLQNKIISSYNTNSNIQVREISSDEFNSKIPSKIANTKESLRSFDLINHFPKSNQILYDINGLEFTKDDNEKEYYKGQWNLKGLKNGVGIYIYSNNSVYYGNFINDIKKGKGILIQENGDYYVGYFDNNLANGKGILSIENHFKYNGSWKDNKKEGPGVELYYKDGSKYEGNFIDNKKQGLGKYFYLDGSHYEGYFSNDMFEGKGKFVWYDGRSYIGDFKKGKINGNGVFSWPNGGVYEGEYKNEKKNGNGVFKFKNGNYIKGFWLNNMLNGKIEIYNNSNYNQAISSALFRFGHLIMYYNKELNSPQDLENNDII